MLQRVDECTENVTGYSYKNRQDEIECVKVFDWNDEWAHVGIFDGDEQECFIFKKDIPNLIKALQAAYEHKEAKK